MTKTPWLGCAACDWEGPLGPAFFGCPACRREGRLSVLDVQYDADARPLCAPFGWRKGHDGAAGIWEYSALLPVTEASSRLSIGEGNTPLVLSRRLGPQAGLGRLYYKNETVSPTWSFKDRYAAVTVSVAKSLGFKKVVVSSTGNHGAAVAAYAAAGGLTCVVLCSAAVPPAMLEQIHRYGAVPVVIAGADRWSLLEHLALKRGWFPAALCLPVPVHNPFGIEGYKTLAYEIVRDLGASPAAVLFPCARGNGLYGAWKGFRELARLGVIDRLPRMIACQPATANTLERSLRAGRIVKIEAPRSIAASITEEVACPQALEAIRVSRGDAVSVEDAAAEEATCQLGAEGLWVETSSGVAVAGAGVLRARGLVSADEAVVVVLTGAGVKWAGVVGAAARPAPQIQGTVRELEACLAREGIEP